MKSKILGLLTAGLLSTLMAANAEAVTLQFTYTVPGASTSSQGGPTWTWYLPSSPSSGSVFNGSVVVDTGFESNGNVVSLGTLRFYPDNQGGGFQTYGGPLNFLASQLFTLDSSNRPTFLTGTFIGYDSTFAGPASLTSTPVPEPGTLALLGLGLAGLGFTRRRSA